MNMIRIDGSRGEGGGQILRTALVLSVVTGRPFHLAKIRAGRAKPGLAPQHLHAVRVFREISSGRCRGDSQGSQDLVFEPGPVHSGSYRVDIGTAGSVTLVLQALALPLSLASGSSEVVLRGGTHVPWSPPFEYIELGWLPLVSRIGLSLEVRLNRAGFYPRGGGDVSARFHGRARIRGLNLAERGAVRAVEILSATARLPTHVLRRQAERALSGSRMAGVPPSVRFMELEAPSPGSAVSILGVFEKSRVLASALGARGKPAETVGEEAASAFRSYLERPGALDPYMADQILLPLVLTEGASAFTTVRLTRHLVTNVEVIRAFLDRPVRIDGEIGAPGRVIIDPS